MDYCSLCRKACLVKDFWKIYIGLILSLLLKWTFYPQRHMILSSADSFCQALICFFKLSPSPSFSKSFKWISLDSKRHPDFTEVIFFVCLYVIFFSFTSNKKFRVSPVYLYGSECDLYGSALLLMVQRDFMIFGHFSCPSCLQASLVPPPAPP